MTEYDYSPEGYERYMETQNRVSNWVSDQTARLQYHSKPHSGSRSGSNPPISSSYRTSSRHGDRSYSRPPSPPITTRPEPKRSLTTPAGALPRSTSRTSHSHVDHHQPAYSYRAPPPTTYYSPPAVVPGGGTYDPQHKTYTYDSSGARQIVLPPLRGGQSYVIIPPSGRRVEVITDPHIYTTSRSSSHSSPRSPVSPTRKDPPLLKRLFSNFGPSPTNVLSKGSGSHRSRSPSSSRRERSRSY